MAKLGYIQLTRRCNQKCIICSNPENRNALSLDEAKKEVDALIRDRYEGIIFSGGEPTLFSDLDRIIEYCDSKKLETRIITNGQKFSSLAYLKKMKDAGLKHIHLSAYSYKDKIQAKISGNPDSLKNIKKTLDNLSRLGGITVDINTAINKYNAEHLSQTVEWMVRKYPFVKHFVFNNLDPHMNRAAENPQTIPRLNDFELELHKALEFLDVNKKTFRVERVPLCYLTDFEYASTETRKMVKKENRVVYFLDQRGRVEQVDWNYKKAEKCKACSLFDICAGLYGAGKFYDEKELYPIFADKKEIISKIKNV